MKRMSAKSAIAAAMALCSSSTGFSQLVFQSFMAGVSIKKSGKGKGRFPTSRYTRLSSNKFNPSQSGVGARECARRVRQMAAA